MVSVTRRANLPCRAGERASARNERKGAGDEVSAMNRTRAAELSEQYVNGWTRQNVSKILAPLSADPVIVECDGTTFSGRDAVNRWFTAWHAAPAHGRVIDWTLLELFIDEASRGATVEWRFRRSCYGEMSSFFGAFTRSAEGVSIDFDASRCFGCGLCVSTCPSGAITFVARS
ncbi:4Fe-4S binding protein [Candidatus Bipolaricaulota bacterium]